VFFDTPIFLVFLALVVVVYWRLRWRKQNIFLLIASYFFYGWWDWRFLSLILISTVVDFFCAKSIAASQDAMHRKILLTVSVVLNLSFLGFFKYFNFFADSFAQVMDALGVPVSTRTLDILLPPGISFYTFQALAYIVDVYYRRLPPAKSLVDYALFISLFPHLIAGPIQRPSHLLPQVQAPRVFEGDRFFSGLNLIGFGLFQKCVIADNCSLLADAAFGGKLGEPSAAVLAIGAFAFAWQIYGDFAGYSSIARGSAQLMGFHFMVNFRQPYLSISLQDFWRRWHISLSTWLRDYLYIPLGGNRGGEVETYRNLFLTMVIGGFWHGANWTFVIWGAIHGAVLSMERILRSLRGLRERKVSEDDAPPSLVAPRLWVGRLIIFLVVCFSWVFFRANSLGDALHMLGGLNNLTWIPEFKTALIFLAMFTLPMLLVDVINERRGEEYFLERSHPYVRVGATMAFVVATILFAGSKAKAFIYFQF
jgi:D-alanyl-lipoteichoic acid acyltransferase DltB (MBOAT superfamily)